MADVLVYMAVSFATDSYDKFARFRSPVIPIPSSAAPDDLAAPSSATPRPILTEHQLRAYHHAWATRHSAVWLRSCALLDAREKGYPACWAGDVNRDTLRAVRAAVDEANWVEGKLKAAIDWCEQRNLSKMSVVKLVQVRRGKSRSVSRPTHSDTPPSLLDLPFPLPEAPASHRLNLTVPRPPPLEPQGHREDEERNRPPTYSRIADWENGESSLEGGFYYDEEVPPVAMEGIVEEGLDVVQYERRV
ncbi:hypothetical protein JCM8547_001696 [Rhodosporidiobolus lusitaniae]